MADGIRKPWLLDYLVTYAEHHGGLLSATRPKRGKVQIINFRTLPESSKEWVWADVSDKQHHVAVRFTMEAVQAFNDDPRNAGRRITSRRWAVTTIQCIQPLWCRPPAHDGRGLEEQWTLALVVDQIQVAGSEGEAMFGEPRSVTKEEPIRRWMEGLRDPHGAGGNVLKQERIEREKEEKGLAAASKSDQKNPHRPLDTAFRVDSRALIESGNPSKSSAHQRLRQWNRKMKELKLVLAHECFEIPENQQNALRDITMFGQDSPTIQHIQLKAQVTEDFCAPSESSQSKHSSRLSSPSKSQTNFPRGPTTPSHWSASQRTNLDQEVNGDEHASDLSYIDSDTVPQELDQNDDSRIEEPQGKEHMIVGDHARAPYMGEADDAIELQREVRRPVVLVPDSDISGSQSLSLSLTQPSVTAPSQQPTREVKFPEPLSDDAIPESSLMQMVSVQSKSPRFLKADHAQEEGEDDTAENEQLESDDEAAEKIMTSDDVADHPTSLRRVHPVTPQQLKAEPVIPPPLRDQVNRASTSQSTPSPRTLKDRTLTPANGPPVGAISVQAVPYNAVGAVHSGTKRALTTTLGRGEEEENERPTKRHKGMTQEIVVERVEHDAFSWKEPSFVRSKSKTETRIKELKREIQQRKHETHHTTGHGRKTAQYVSATPGERWEVHDIRQYSAPQVAIETPEHEESSINKSKATQDSRLRSMTSPGARYKLGDRHQRGGLSRSTSSVTVTPHAATLPQGQPFVVGSHPEPAELPLVLERPQQRSLTRGHPIGLISNVSFKHDKKKLLKLGGWRPRQDIEPGPGIITWGDLNKILLTVGSIREQAKKIQSKT